MMFQISKPSNRCEFFIVFPTFSDPGSLETAAHHAPAICLFSNSLGASCRHWVICLTIIQDHPISSKSSTVMSLSSNVIQKKRILLVSCSAAEDCPSFLTRGKPWGVRLGHGFLPMNTRIGELQDCLKIFRSAPWLGSLHRKWNLTAGKIMGRASI